MARNGPNDIELWAVSARPDSCMTLTQASAVIVATSNSIGISFDADPNPCCSQEFDVAQSKALNASESEVEPPQQPEDGGDCHAFTEGFDGRRAVLDQENPEQAKRGDREVEPVGNDAVADVDPGKNAAKGAQQCERQQDSHRSALVSRFRSS